MVEVEILGCVITAQYGTLSQGDILRTNEAFAAHLVDDCKAAKYRNELPAPVAAEPVDVIEQEKSRATKRPPTKGLL